MPRTSTDAPKFRSDAEEADWYATPQGRRQTRREFARALKEGTAIRPAGSKISKTDTNVLLQLMEQARQNATRAISIRVPIADLEQAQRIAQKTGVGYQTVLKQAIRKGLKRAG
jgi:predicted DNA binding CopG/RHH family protein